MDESEELKRSAPVIDRIKMTKWANNQYWNHFWEKYLREIVFHVEDIPTRHTDALRKELEKDISENMRKQIEHEIDIVIRGEIIRA